MSEQPNQEYQRAIESAQREMDQLSEKIKALEKYQQRYRKLEAFIGQGKVLVEESIEPSQPSAHEKVISFGLTQPDSSEKPIYLKMVQILKEAGKPMTLAGMVEEFRKRNWKLSEKNPREVLRNTLKTKPHVFVRAGQGEGGQALYALRE
jgi:hypothetical protein